MRLKLPIRCASWHCPSLVKRMMQKHAMTIHKPWPQTGSFGGQLHDIVAKLRNAIKFEVPTGYQDETGFHLGVKPAEKQVQWPPVW